MLTNRFFKVIPNALRQDCDIIFRTRLDGLKDAHFIPPIW